MSMLNYIYALMISFILGYWYYRLTVQHLDVKQLRIKASIYLSYLVVGLFISIQVLIWAGNPGIDMGTRWMVIIPEDQLPSRIFFWVLTLTFTVVFMIGICTSKGWGSWVNEPSGTDMGWPIFISFMMFLSIGAFSGFFFSLSVMQILMRLA